MAMEDQSRKRRLLPSKFSRERTIVIVVLIGVVVIAAIVLALALTSHESPSSSNPTATGGYNVPYPVSANITPPNVSVTSFTFTQNSSGETTFLIPVTNTGNSSVAGAVNVVVSENPGLPSPNQPYPSNRPPPTPVSNAAYQNSTQVELAPGEMKTVEVSIGLPPGFTVNPSNVLISVT
ncbi:MAG: hypothetical protein ACM3L5_00580 [Candidatus Saccharibacteria bacterium]